MCIQLVFFLSWEMEDRRSSLKHCDILLGLKQAVCPSHYGHPVIILHCLLYPHHMLLCKGLNQH